MSFFCCGFEYKKLEQKLQNILSLLHEAIDGTVFTGIIQPSGKVLAYQVKTEQGIKERVEKFLQVCLQFKATQQEVVKTTGHNFCRETIIRSANSIICIYTINAEHYLIIELNLTLQEAEFFDAELYSMNIDELIDELTRTLPS